MRRLAAAALCLGLTACGTTVALPPGQLPAGLDEVPATSGSAGSPDGLPPDASSPGGGGATAGGRVDRGAGGTTARPGQRPAPGQAPATPAAGGVPGRGRGYDAKTIRIGFSISSDSAAALGGFGLVAEVADQRSLIRTFVAQVNREGGVAGRQVVPVIYDYSATGDKNTQDQAACATWTQDEPVFAATGVRAGATGHGDTLTACLSKAGVPWLQGLGDRAKWKQYFATLYATAAMDSTREQRLLVESLAAQGELTSRSKVGVVISDSQGDYSGAVRDGTEPALARLGLKVTRKVVIRTAQTDSRNAELQMFAAGVTHVLFAAPGGAGAAFFMQAAESQGRTYRYGVSSQDAPGIAVQGLAPANQLRNARGYGYKPSLDVDDSHQPPQTAGMRQCFDLYKRNGYSTASLNRAAMAIVCDGLRLLQAALRGQTNPTTPSFAAGVAGLGERLPVAGTFAARFSDTRHDGAAAYRFLSWSTADQAFVYSGALRASS